MVRHPDGRCRRCGEREYATADGSVWCPNCARLDDEFGDEGVTDEAATDETVADETGE